jgi:serine/threonine protein kinase/Tol biopolymer transport system component
MIQRPDWKVLQELFEGALRLPASERSAYLQAHARDEAIRAEVASLLSASDHAGEFMEQPAPVGEHDPVGDAPRVAAGSRFGVFEILEPLGSGGMGEVYRARDTRLDRFVAVKVLSRDLDLAPHGRDRFSREARAISKLSHPHICTLHDVGAAELGGREVPFLVLELLDGETLATRLRRGPLPVEQALIAAIEMAGALAAAHHGGIVHRDLKPSNVMMTSAGVKLLDFGLAQLRVPERASAGPADATASSLTSAGMLIGTLPYMAPEQLEGRKADPRSDIFSFGAVLYEMLTGQRAFPGEAGRSAAAQILSDDPKPVDELTPAVPADVAKIVSRCLRKDPARRYQDIADVKVALDDARRELSTEAGPATSHTGWRWRPVWLVVLAAALLMAAYVMRSPRAASESLPPPRIVPLTTLPGAEVTPTLAPDGQSVAFVWSGLNRDNDDIYVQHIGGSEVRRTTDPARDFSPAWSPDGQWIAFLRGQMPGTSELMLVSPLGGAERPLGEIQIRYPYARPPYLAWFPDSQALVVVHTPPDQPTGLSVITIATREMQPVTSPPASPGFDMSPAVSPDGRTLAFMRGPDVYVAGIAEDRRSVSSLRRVMQTHLGTGGLAWTPDGRQLVFASDRTLFRVDAAGAWTPVPVPFVGQDVLMPAISRSGAGNSMRLAYVQMTSDANIWRLDLPAAGAPTSAAPVVFSPSTQLDANPQFAPDGRHVAFQSMRSGAREIWIADADGGNARRLTSMGEGARGTPRWSPDGQWIAFDANLDGQWDVYLIAAAGGKPRRMTFERGEDAVPSFSVDGKFLYFTSERSGTSEIYKMPVSGGDAASVTHDGGVVAFESRDGYLYYTVAHSGTSSLWRVPTAGGQRVRVLDGVASRAFQVLDRGIYYIERFNDTTPIAGMGVMAGVGLLRSNERARLHFFDFATATSKTVAHLEGPVALGLAASPDGRTVLFTRVDSVSSDLMMVENFR